MTNYLEVALKYHEAGLHIIPVDDKKRPYKTTWKEFIENQTKEDVLRLFKNPCYGIALICTKDIEVIDFDLKNDSTGQVFNKYAELQKNDPFSILKSVCVQSTQSNGFHFIYKTFAAEGNQKLANQIRGDKSLVVIETRGLGGYIVLYPTPGYQLKRGDVTDLKYITHLERENALAHARSFNEEPVRYIDIENLAVSDAYKWRFSDQNRANKLNDYSVIENYNERITIQEIDTMLTSNDWQYSHKAADNLMYTRPGKDIKDGVSAGLHIDTKIFNVFTTSSGMEKAYNPFQLYAYFNNLSHKEAAYKLFLENPPPKVEEPKERTYIQNILDNVFDFDKPIENMKSYFTYKSTQPGFSDKEYPIGFMGTLGGIFGMQKSRKTQIMNKVIASALSGSRKLRFNFELEGKNILLFDTEQPQSRFQRNCKHILVDAGIQGNSKNFHAFNLRPYTWDQRLNAIKEIITLYDNIGMIVIDGIVDICEDFMDSQKSIKTIQELMKITDTTGAMLFGMLHLTKSGEYGRGHLGTEFQNKCDFIIQTKKSETNITEVTCKECREEPFHKFYVNQDATGLYICDPEGNIIDIREDKNYNTKTNLSTFVPKDFTEPTYTDELPF
jgi:Bifunctional DNA primase/polymerase, N-terminal